MVGGNHGEREKKFGGGRDIEVLSKTLLMKRLLIPYNR